MIRVNAAPEVQKCKALARTQHSVDLLRAELDPGVARALHQLLKTFGSRLLIVIHVHSRDRPGCCRFCSKGVELR
eukprot:Skav201119  [mRNA]  locus=scaffold185:443943:446869:- [translate_table: standard]